MNRKGLGSLMEAQRPIHHEIRKPRKLSMHMKQEPLLIIPRRGRQWNPHNVADKPTTCPRSSGLGRGEKTRPPSVLSLLTGAPCSFRHFWIP